MSGPTLNVCPSLPAGARRLLNFAQILCHFQLHNDLQSSAAPDELRTNSAVVCKW